MDPLRAEVGKEVVLGTASHNLRVFCYTMREDTVRKRLTKSKLRLTIHCVPTAQWCQFVRLNPIGWLGPEMSRTQKKGSNIFAKSDCWVEDWLVLQPAEDSILWGWLPLLLVRVVVSADRCQDDD